jgi:hypothetical protein
MKTLGARRLLVAGMLVLATVAVARPALADNGATVVPVDPLPATINAAAFQPLPSPAVYVIRRDDDSETHDAIHAALASALPPSPAQPDTAPVLEMDFDVHVIRSGVPEMAKGVLEMEDVRGTGRPATVPPTVNATDLRGRTTALEGNVLHLRQDSFASVMRLQVTVSDPRTGAYLWRGWVDTPLNRLSRAEVAALVADPLLAALGQTVAGREMRIEVPAAMGGGS